jgi:hypothetical protein
MFVSVDMWTKMVGATFARLDIGVTNARHAPVDPVQELVLATVRVRQGGMATGHARVASTSRAHLRRPGCWANTFRGLTEIVSIVKMKQT